MKKSIYILFLVTICSMFSCTQKVDNTNADCPCIFQENQPPFFKSCEGSEDGDDRWDCMRQTLVRKIYNEIHYPAEARDNCIEGNVVVRLDMDIEGRVIKREIVNEPLLGYGLEDAVLELVDEHLSDNWCPGLINCEPVEMSYTMPVKFKK